MGRGAALTLVVASASVACSGSVEPAATEPSADGGTDASGGAAGAAPDGAAAVDAGISPDAGAAADAGASVDAQGQDAPADQYVPPPPSPTTRCELTAPTDALPGPDCASAPVATAIALPISNGAWGEVPVLGAAHLVGPTLYASFSLGSCFKDCIYMAGLFRTTRGPTWEPVAQDVSELLLAARDSELFWVESPTNDVRQIHRVRLDTLASSVSGTVGAGLYLSGIAIGQDALFSLTATDPWLTTTLESHAIMADGTLGEPDERLVIGGNAGALKSNGQVLGWLESGALVVADFSGIRQHVVALPHTNSAWMALSDGYAFAIYEEGIGLDGTNLCALDLATGEAEVIVPQRALMSICSVAANSTHVFWTQSSAPDVACDQVWMKPLDGGTPRVLACNVGHSQSKPPMVYANDEVVYWVGSDVRVLDAQGL